MNWDGLGAVASRRSRLFLSQTHDIWRLDNDVTGLDGANVSDWSVFDCVFSGASRTAFYRSRRMTYRGVVVRRETPL